MTPKKYGTICSKKIWWCLVRGRVNTKAVLSEWLRSLTRNQMGSARTGSNPVDRVLLDLFTNQSLVFNPLVTGCNLQPSRVFTQFTQWTLDRCD